jgi:hypothetical protein
MNVYVDLPYEDELIYSQCVRYLSEFSLVSHDMLVKEMFGAKLELSPHMPRNLHEFAERTGRSVAKTKENLFWRHSMFPLICAYLPEERRMEAMEYAFYGLALKKMPQILAAIVPPKYLRWCPDCAAEDRARANCGEAFWHRVHQISGVWQCEKHGIDLVDSEIPRFASGIFDLPADVVIPEDVHRFRKKRRCTSMEAMLRKRLVALLNAGNFPHRPEHPNYREAAVRAGFRASQRKIDYPWLYESFSEYWGDVLDRVDVLHRTRVMRMGWLHAQFNKKNIICRPVVRELIDIFFRDRFGIDINEMPSEER